MNIHKDLIFRLLDSSRKKDNSELAGKDFWYKKSYSKSLVILFAFFKAQICDLSVANQF